MENFNRLLLNDKKPLLESEFKYIFPKFNYEQYLMDFYAKKLTQIFKFNFQKSWFRERYFEEQRKEEDYAKNYTAFLNFINEHGVNKQYGNNVHLEEGEFYVIFTLLENIAASEMKFIAEKYFAKKYHSVQNDNIKVFTRLGILIYDSEDDAKNAVEKLRSEYYFDYIVLKTAASLKKRANHHMIEESDYKYLLDILHFLNGKYGTDYSIPDNVDMKMLYGIYLLRFTFHFCFYCFKKYDSETHLFINCGDFHTYSFLRNQKDRKVFERNFYFLQYDYTKIKAPSISGILMKKYVLFEARKIMCSTCQCELMDDENLQLEHYKNKHISEYDEILIALSESKIFLSKIDIFMIEVINNSNNRRQIPDLLRNFDEYNVRYDLPYIYEDL